MKKYEDLDHDVMEELLNENKAFTACQIRYVVSCLANE